METALHVIGVAAASCASSGHRPDAAPSSSRSLISVSSRVYLRVQRAGRLMAIAQCAGVDRGTRPPSSLSCSTALHADPALFDQVRWTLRC